MEIEHIFETKEGFITALNHIRSWGSRRRDGTYIVELDLQEMFEPLKEIFVEINYRIRRMIFRGDEGAVRALYYDCTPQP